MVKGDQKMSERKIITTETRPVWRTIQRMLLLDVMKDKGSQPAFLWAISTLAIGTFLFHWIEGWNYLDSLYFCVISLATVGYGDFTPDTPLGKVLAIIYIINGIGILLALFDRIRAVRTRSREAAVE